MNTAIETRVATEGASTGVSYALWFFFGGLGVHRFYMGRKGTGFLQLVLMLAATVGWLGAAGGSVEALLVASTLGLCLGLWLFIDMFRIPAMCRKERDNLRAKYEGVV